MDIQAIYNEHSTNPAWSQFTEDDVQDTILKIYEKQPDISLDTKESLKFFYIFCRNVMRNRRKTAHKQQNLRAEHHHDIVLMNYDTEDIEDKVEEDMLYDIQLNQLKHHINRKYGKLHQTLFFAYLSPTNKLIDICRELDFSYSKGKQIIRECKVELSNFLEIDIDEIIQYFKVNAS
jgi:DNA-directed RNA polymerase specialized sigma24 family protein